MSSPDHALDLFLTFSESTIATIEFLRDVDYAANAEPPPIIGGGADPTTTEQHCLVEQADPEVSYTTSTSIV
jgi:hypothetical protein